MNPMTALAAMLPGLLDVPADPDAVRMRHPLTDAEREEKRAIRARRKAERDRKRDQRRKNRR